MARARTYILVDPSTDAQTQLGVLYGLGLIGSHNGYHLNEGGAVVTVSVYDPAAYDQIDANPLLTRLPNPDNPAPDAVKQKHLDKLPKEVMDKLKVEKPDKVDKDGKLKAPLPSRELAETLHDTYKRFTKHLHPDY